VFSLHPRFFRVATDGIEDSLPGGAAIRIEFQGAPASSPGVPNEALASAWSANVDSLESVAGLAFLRFRRAIRSSARRVAALAAKSATELGIPEVPFRD